MKFRNIILPAIMLVGTGFRAQAAKQCMPCEPGKWSAGGTSGACTQNCPAGHYCQGGVKIACTGTQYCPAGSSNPQTCVDDSKVLVNNSTCSTISSLSAGSFNIYADSSPAGYNSCKNGIMDPGIYRVVLGGGDSNASGGRLTYNFRLKQFAEYSLCAGANAEGVSSGCGQRPGAAGSYLKLVINGKDYYFAAGGSGGAGIDCGGPGGGGIGGGGSPGKCTLKAGAAVGPYAGGAVKSSIIGAGGGQGLNAGGFGYGCDSGAGGGGGGDGSSRYGGKGIDITVGTILMNGSFGTFTGRLGSQGCSTTECVNATATHASNTAAETCAACAKLYMIKR